MGMMISTIVGVLSLVVFGILTAVAASKSQDCKEGKKLGIIISTSEFVVAIVLFGISILLL